jgi:type IV secretion system protein VirB10
MGFMTVLGLAALSWYYANTMTRQRRAQDAVQAQAQTLRAQGDVSLPALGRIDPPAPVSNGVREPPDLVPPAPLPTVLDEVPVSYGGAVPGSGNATPAAKTPAQLALERQLAGNVFLPSGAATSTASPVAPVPSVSGPLASGVSLSGVMPPALSDDRSDDQAGQRKPDDWSGLLHATITPAARAQLLPTQRLLLPKGAFLDCTLETAIDSTLPGMTTCILATDSFGADGKVVLLERGTKLVGETKGQVQQGAARVFVLWTEARTPTGVIVPLSSPGTDELGRAGVAGTVDRHFWQRFGAAMLVSIIDGALQSAEQSSRGGTVVYDPSASQTVMTEVLKSTVNIPPTVLKRQGDRIAVLVARDLDFRSVYELRALAAGR